MLTTHHASNGQGALVVSNNQGVCTQADFLTVEQLELFAGFSHTNADTAIDLLQVKGVHRLAQLKHHVVGDIDGGINAADIRTTQTLDHPQRGRLGQVNIAQHASQVTRASFRRHYFHWNNVVIHRRDNGYVRTGNGSGVQGTDFTRQTRQGQAVATVRRQVDFNAGVIQAQVHANVLTYWRIGRQLHQAAALFTDLQLGSRAQHAVGLNAPQLGFFDFEIAGQLGTDHGERNPQARSHVRRTANNLEGFTAIADLAHTQLVGVRMLFSAKHLSHHNTAEYAGGQRHAVDLKTGHGQTGDQLITGNLRAYPATQPLFTEFHSALLLENVNGQAT